MSYFVILTAYTAWIIVGVIFGVILLGVIGFLLYKFVFIKKRFQRQIKELERRYSYLDALMIGQDAQYIKRLEMISRTNLLYVDIYNEYQKKFKQIFEIEDRYVQGIIRQLKTLVENKQYGQAKKALQEGRKALSTFEKSANELDQGLSKLIRPEEEARQYALRLKELLRSVKQTYNANANELEIVANSLESIFEKIDHKFKEFENHIECAEYDEANNILPIIEKVVNQLKNELNNLPNTCLFITKILPEKVEALENEYDLLLKQEYPLHHLMLTRELKLYKDKINDLKTRLVELNTKDVLKEGQQLQESIENMLSSFKKEIEAKSFFDDNCNQAYEKVLELERNFLRLCSLLPEMNRIYKISDEDSKRINHLKDDVNQLGTAKRSLDTYIHSSTPQPYSILKDKLERLLEDYEKTQSDVENFKKFLEGLKTSSEEAYSLIFSYYYHLKQVELQLQNIAIKATSDKYKEQIVNCYALLNDIEETLKVSPIDVNLINTKVSELKEISGELFDNVNNATNVSQLAESAIIYANRDRFHQNDVHQQLLLCEQQFFNGDFETTYHDVVQLLKNNHVDESMNNN